MIQSLDLEHTRRPVSWKAWVLGAITVAATFIAYSHALHGGFIWDDKMHITRPELRTLSGLYRIWFEIDATFQYYPVLHTAFWLEHKLWGDATLGYHLLNVLLHLSSALMVAQILRRLSIPGAFLAAAIFALHPVHVESVAWMSEQKNTLSTVFYLATILAYLRFDETRRADWYLGTLGLFICALLSKTVTGTLPGALLVIFWWQRGRLSWRRDVLPTVPLFLLGAAGGLLTAWWELQINHSTGSGFQFTMAQRLLLPGRAVWFYIGKLCWPANLSFIYPRWEVDTSIAWQYLFPLGIAGLAAAFWGIRRRTRGPLAALLFFVGTLFPTLGFFNFFAFRYSLVADHLQYLASLGPIVLFAAGATWACLRLGPNVRKMAAPMAGVLLLTLGALTWRQSGVYRSSDQVWIDTLQKNPACWIAHNNLGDSYARQGRIEEAFSHLREAVRLKSDDEEIHNNLGVVLARKGQVEEAILHFREAVRLKPDCAKAHHNWGLALASQGRMQEAIAHYREASRIKASHARGSLDIALTGQ
jgi:hypothetical protein